MCWGDTEKAIFSEEFIEKRSTSLRTNIKGYKEIVISKLYPVMNYEYNTVILWFGTDMFCKMNMITLLAYFDSIDYKKDVYWCVLLEDEKDVLEEYIEIDVKGYYDLYVDILYKKIDKVSKYKDILHPITIEAIKLYLNYKDINGDIMYYIKNNIDKEDLVLNLLSKFSNYGLGDRQYEWMIEEIKNNK